MGGTDSDVVVGGLLVVEVAVGEEVGQLRLDAAQGLVLSVEQQDQVGHTEALEHQRQQLPKEPCRANQTAGYIYRTNQTAGYVYRTNQAKIAILVKIIAIRSFPQIVLPYDVSSVFFYREVGDGEERR